MDGAAYAVTVVTRMQPHTGSDPRRHDAVIGQIARGVIDASESDARQPLQDMSSASVPCRATRVGNTTVKPCGTVAAAWTTQSRGELR